MRLQIRSPTSRAIVTTLTPSSTVVELMAAVETAVGVIPAEQRLLIGFPPKDIDLSTLSVTLADVGVKSGDSIMVEMASAKRGIVKATAEESAAIIYSIAKNEGLFVQRQMPPDNSCLFHTIGYICMDRMRDASQMLRKLVADKVASDPATYNETLLEQPNRSYQSWIMNPKVWGGAIELCIFSQLFETELVAFDPDYLREDVYGQNMGYRKRSFVLYTTGAAQGQATQGGHSAHYDALVFNSSSTAPESTDKVVFSSSDSYAWDRARQFIESLHKDHVAKDPSLRACKKWRRSQTGEEVVPIGRSLLDDAAAAASPWSCRSCTFLNVAADDTCSMCHSDRS